MYAYFFIQNCFQGIPLLWSIMKYTFILWLTLHQVVEDVQFVLCAHDHIFSQTNFDYFWAVIFY